MKDEAFCLIGMLISREMLERAVQLLPPDRQVRVNQLSTDFSQVSPTELQSKCMALVDSASRNDWREVPPSLRTWWAKWAKIRK